MDALLHRDDAAALVERHGRAPVLGALRAALDDARARGRAEPAEDLVAAAARLLERPPSLRPVLNATGVIVHTNLGRAPLPRAALERVARVAGGLLEPRARPRDRPPRLPARPTSAPLLAELTGAEDGLAVNNNAAALLLCLAATAGGREVLIGRGELIEIGDGFRIPDILAQSGATAGRGGHDQPHDAADYERPPAPTPGDPARAPVELPHGRLHRRARRWPSWRRSARGTACR